MDNTDFLCERKLAKSNPNYHELVKNTAFVMHSILDKYTNYFPEYTDHSSLHSLQVIDFCNKLIADQIEMFNDDELYVLLMSCYLHDTGMGISDKDYEKLRDKIVSPEYKKSHPDLDVKETIRNFHHEFSAGFIRKYAQLFEIPSDEHIEAIIQVSRGHRKTDLYDETEYPADFKVSNGNKICLPYLSSLIRLADELDIARDRNVGFDYSQHQDNIEWRKHYAIEHMEITDDAFVLYVDSEDADIHGFVDSCIEKLQETLDLCRDVTNSRTKYKIKQDKVITKLVEKK